MPALPQEVLSAKLAAALPGGTRWARVDEIRPAEVDIPRFGRVRIYLWTITEDHSRQGRPIGEYKIQLILPGQHRGARGRLQVGGDALTALLGFSPDFGVFGGWEPARHADFGYSKNVQCKAELLAEARRLGSAVSPPRQTEEVVVAFGPGNLTRYLEATLAADEGRLVGVQRQAFLLAQFETPLPRLPPDVELPAFVAEQRRRIHAERWERDPLFAVKIRAEYESTCAVCATQLGIVEAAHILSVGTPGSTDERWNGVALC